jgi:DNA-binding NarL/FixJ family response regulator
MPPTFTDEGLRAARQIKERWPATAILVLSQHVQASYAVELLSLGASGTGYLLKDRVADLAELAASVRRVGEGGSVLDPSVVEQLVEQRRTRDEPLERLSARERDVLAAMAEGLTNKGIAERLFIAEHTVEKHISNIFAGLQLPATDSDHRRVLAVVTYLDAH